MDYMLSREDGKHMSHSEFMESDIFSLMEAEMRIYNKKKKEKEIDAETAFDLI
ncbi:hypothetical protein ABHD89_000151 [Salinicoccus halitifaciens]|uniref:Uncharacterized protein n=1 Tax=Salinicoccus halitifaciens TaxID=1073415 RepID=A0ABV2E5U5_9STAP